MAVPVPNYKRIVCAAKRSGASPTKLRAGLTREQFNPAIHRPLWNTLVKAAGLNEHPDSSTRQLVLTALLGLMTDELAAATPEMVAQILSVQRDLLEGVECR